MRRRHGVLPGVLAAALMGASLGHAQTLSLRQGFEAAWTRQPESQAAALRREAAGADMDAARRWTPGPAALELTTRTDRFNRDAGRREYEAGLAVPLWLPGERDGAQALASSEAGAVDARLQAAQWRVAAEVREAYWAWQRTRIEHELARQRLANARRLAEDVARRLRAGDLARADGHQAEGTVAAAEAELAQATVARTQAMHDWTRLTGSQEPPAEAPEGVGEPPPAEAPLQAVHPALRELAAKAEVARRQRQLADAQARANPEVMLGTARERDVRGERFDQSLFVGIRIPLGRSHASQSRQISASADLLEAQTQLTLEEGRVRAQIGAARDKLESLRQAQDAARRRAALARESRGFFEKSFRLGETDLPTRLRIELEAFEAERQAARGGLEVSAAVSQLRHALGLLPE